MLSSWSFSVFGNEQTIPERSFTLLEGSGGAQDGLARYLMYFETGDFTPTADIYWNNNTVLIDGTPKSGDVVGIDGTVIVDGYSVKYTAQDFCYIGNGHWEICSPEESVKSVTFTGIDAANCTYRSEYGDWLFYLCPAVELPGQVDNTYFDWITLSVMQDYNINHSNHPFPAPF